MSELPNAMRAINAATPGDEATRFDALYWWLTTHHAGQWSPEYRVLCAVERIFKPSPCARGPEDYARDVYKLACDAAGCSHSDSDWSED